MTLTQLRYLVAVADHGHFGRAAEACGVSQPTLSAQLRKLEDYLDAPLVARGGGPARLTPLGERVLERARRMLDLAEEVKGAARRACEPLVGPFRIGVIPTLCPYFLPWALPALRARFPRLELITRELRTEDALTELRRRGLDAAVVAEPATDAALRTEPLFSEPFLAALPADHPLAGRAAVSAAALAGERVLVLEEGHCLRDQTLAYCETTAPDPAGARATSLETLLGLVAVGEGVTLAPALAAQGRLAPAMRPLSPPAARRLVLVSAAASARRSEMRLLADALREAAPSDLVDAETLPGDRL
jgi:LysR family hydrogen peroxide-inducible transcriptional activator